MWMLQDLLDLDAHLCSRKQRTSSPLQVRFMYSGNFSKHVRWMLISAGKSKSLSALQPSPRPPPASSPIPVLASHAQLHICCNFAQAGKQQHTDRIVHGKQTSHLTLATISRVALVRKRFSLRSSTRQDEYMQRDETRQAIYIYMYIRHEIHPVTRRAVVQQYIYILYIYICIYIYIS